MKKRISLILIAVICLSLMLVLTSCGGNKDSDECTEHTYGEWTTVLVESCTEPGSEKRVCTKCSHEETREVPASHNWENWKTVTEATCETAGEATRACRECDATETETLKATGHQKVITTEAKDPTEYEDGSTEGAKCANCDFVYSVAMVIPKYANIATPEGTKATTGESWWGFEGTVSKLYDGDINSTTRSPKGGSYTIQITLKDGAFVKHVVVACNGSGKIYDIYSSTDVSEIEYNVKSVSITCYKDGEVVDNKRFEDTTNLTEVKLENVDKNVDTVEIYVESAVQNNGNAYIWEIGVIGTAPLTECDINGHQWGDWAPVGEVNCLDDYQEARTCSVCQTSETRDQESKGHDWSEWGTDIDGAAFEKEASCKEAGYVGRMCFVCGEEEYEDIPKAEHVWSAWDITGDCDTGATKHRVCSVCETEEDETTAPGEHADIYYEGRVEPTKEQDGSTGTKKCRQCGKTLAGAKVLRIANVAKDGTITTTHTSFWAATDGNASKLIDGNRETGMMSDPTLVSMNEFITLASGSDVFEVVLVVNSKGSIAQGGNIANVTNNDYKISFIISAENDEVLFRSEEYSTLNQTVITVPVELPEGKEAKKIKITHTNSYGVSANYLWEVEIFELQELSACDATGHEWGEWQITEPYCTQDSLVNGVKERVCEVCLEREEVVLTASHSWSEWNMSGINCATGGTKTRECESCHKQESETVAAGGHLNVELQGAKEPTLEEDGYTGDYVCTACGEKTADGIVIPKLVNVALNATASTNSANWLIVGQGEESWYPSRVPTINDGNLTNGSGVGDYNRGTVDFILTWDEAVQINKVIYVCNGSGNLGYNLGGLENTNYAIRYVITIYDASDNIITTAEGNTQNQTQIEVEIAEGSAAVKKVVLTLANAYGQTEGGVFEIMAIAPGQAN